MRWYILVVSLSVVSCRPQQQQSVFTHQDASKPTVENSTPKVSIVPFYGGGKGQSLQITEFSDGTVNTMIIKTPETTTLGYENTSLDTSELENPPLPSRHELEYGAKIKNIHNVASDILKLQEIAKNKGSLTKEEEAKYQANLTELNETVRNLTKLQEEADQRFENREGISAWLDRRKNNAKEKEKSKKNGAATKNKNDKEDEEAKDASKGKKKKPPPKEEGNEEEVAQEEDDGVAIDLPSDDASVAEAKPIGLAVAGEGGVAASKPIATAVVGPGGLAIARPVGTAIAGVSPDQALVPIYAEGYVGAIKPSRDGTKKKANGASEYLNRIISKYHQY